METEEKRDAYLKGLKLKNTGLDEETIAIRLEKQGVSFELAKEVARNVFIQRKKEEEFNKVPETLFTSRKPLLLIIAERIRSLFR